MEEALKSSRKRRRAEYRSALRSELSAYLGYVNANLVLANTFGCGFHDWADYRPFYRDKFLRIGKESFPAEQEMDAISQLFNISFPHFSFWNPRDIVKAVKDKRISELRQLVDASVRGDVTFDKDFAVRVLREVLDVEQRIAGFRKVVSYVTAPVGFIPAIGTPAQKAMEEAIVKPFENTKRRPYRWFYLISEMSKRVRSRDDNG